jgi:hypothetical protein
MSPVQASDVPVAVKKLARQHHSSADPDKLADYSNQDFMEFFCARQRRKFSCGIKRETAYAEKPEAIQTHLRNMIIVPKRIGSIVGLHKGQKGGNLAQRTSRDSAACNFSAYIPMSDTFVADGQNCLEAKLFYKGIRLAVNDDLFVNCVGSAVPIDATCKKFMPDPREITVDEDFSIVIADNCELFYSFMLVLTSWRLQERPLELRRGRTRPCDRLASWRTKLRTTTGLWAVERCRQLPAKAAR